jgi:hypothetical protein
MELFRNILSSIVICLVLASIVVSALPAVQNRNLRELQNALFLIDWLHKIYCGPINIL